MRLNNMGDLVNILIEKEEYQEIQNLEKEYLDIFKDLEYLVDEQCKGEQGILLKYFGDYYLKIGDIDKAVQYYIRGIKLIPNYKEHTSYSFIFQIKNIQRRLESSPSLAKVKIELGKRLSKLWRNDSRLCESYPEALRYFIRWQKGTE